MIRVMLLGVVIFQIVENQAQIIKIGVVVIVSFTTSGFNGLRRSLGGFGHPRLRFFFFNNRFSFAVASKSPTVAG